MLVEILSGVAVLIVLFVVVVALRPADFCVTRSASMAAPPAVAFVQVNDFHMWEAWSPWAKIDPAVKNTFEGALAGVGAGFSWSGNNQVGQGRMTITDSRPDLLVRIRLEFLKPFKATHTAEFSFRPEGGKTLVTWSMYGKNNFFSKAFALFVDCDKMLGGQFEKGLAQMKSVAETAAKI